MRFYINIAKWVFVLLLATTMLLSVVPLTKVFAASNTALSIIDYTTITVPSTNSMAFDGSEELSGIGCYAKGYRFWGNAGQVIQIRMDSSDLESFLILYDASFKPLMFDYDKGGGGNALISYYLTNSAYYYIEATMFTNRVGLATLSIAYTDILKLTYDANGGAGAPDPINFGAGQQLTIPDCFPSRVGYIFMGWSLSPTSTSTKYLPAGNIVLEESTTLYAVWGEYTPILAPYTGNHSLSSSDGYSFLGTFMKGFSLNLPEGKLLSISMLTEDFWAYLVIRDAAGNQVDYGLYFDGANDCCAFADFSVSSSGTYYIEATIEPGFGHNGTFTLTLNTYDKYCSLEYEANGGYGAPSPVDFIAGQGLAIADNFPSKAGHIFMGWSLSPTSTNAQYLPSDHIKLNESATLYAVWKEYTPVTLPFSISGSLNVADGLSQRGTKMNGYSYYAPAGSAIVATMVSNDIDSYLYLLDSAGDVVAFNDDFGGTTNAQIYYIAKTAGTYYLQATTHSSQTGYYDLGISFASPQTLIYNTQGGSPSLPGQTIFASSTAYISNTLPIRMGYTFLGWNTDPDGLGAFYQRGWPVISNSDLFLYAIWQPHQYPIYDISASSSQNGQITINSPLLENDRRTRYNAYRIWLTHGQTVAISMDSDDFDSYLYLLDASGSYLTEDDDSGGSLNALLIFDVPTDGWYYILASQNSRWPDYGSYTLSCIQQTALPITISGAVFYQPSPVVARLELLDNEHKLIAYDYTTSEGDYSLTIPDALSDTPYTLKVTKPGYLSYTIKNLTINNSIEEINFDLTHMAGDVNGDGVINAEDLTILLSQFNRAPDEENSADIDGNGIVNAVDLAYLLAGFNKSNVDI
ncbi:MAG: InlB B-repeat-containing protein [Clostridiales bacterium]|nr:InlB B-repeat-containing protein [Clostridiales bacterium]